MLAERLSDDRLCWLAVRDKLRRNVRKRAWLVAGLVLLAGLIFAELFGVDWWTRRLIGTVSGAAAVAVLLTARDVVKRRMHLYGFAVTDTVRELSAEDRARLRETRQVPPWFFDRVITRQRTGR